MSCFFFTECRSCRMFFSECYCKMRPRIDEAAMRDRRREKTCRREETSRNRGSDPRRAQLGIPHAHLTDFLSPDAVIAGFGNSIRGFVLRSLDFAEITLDREVHRFFQQTYLCNCSKERAVNKEKHKHHTK